MVKQRQGTAAVALTQEQEELAQRIYQRLQTKMNEELLAMARLMAAKSDHEIFGPGEFELRDKLNQVGATIVSEAANERSKKGVPR
jgi:tRNA A37 N6-isopentenylltransferase MiaA